MDKDELSKQTKLAFEYLHKLYFETSYLIKEVEGLLAKETEEFIIGRPSGYGVTTNRSTGLETKNVELWTMRKMAVFFVPRGFTIEKNGQTTTKFNNGPKVIYLRIILDSKGLPEPKLFVGILYDFIFQGKATMEKVEQLMTHIEYREQVVFKDPLNIDYIDGYISFKGKLFAEDLFTLTSSEDVLKKVVKPAVALFRAG